MSLSSTADLLQFYPWRLSDLPAPSNDSPQVVSTFSCGGGSSMGYRLAGLKVRAAVDIDPAMTSIYGANLDTPQQLTMGVRELLDTRPDLVEQWQDIDVLDGSPPCTLFTQARPGGGQRDWGKKKKFREGQAEQVLDQLFFDYLELAEATRPKVIIAENVGQMVYGQTKGYVKAVVLAGRRAGYRMKVFRVRAGDHGVPQQRSRLFFLGHRDDLPQRDLPVLPATGVVYPRDAFAGLVHDCPDSPCPHTLSRSEQVKWESFVRYGDPRMMSEAGLAYFGSGQVMIHPDRIGRSVTAGSSTLHWTPRKLTAVENLRLFSFPDDYSTRDSMNQTRYVTGMSVPPLLMRAVALHVRRHWLD